MADRHLLFIGVEIGDEIRGEDIKNILKDINDISNELYETGAGVNYHIPVEGSPFEISIEDKETIVRSEHITAISLALQAIDDHRHIFGKYPMALDPSEWLTGVEVKARLFNIIANMLDNYEHTMCPCNCNYCHDTSTSGGCEMRVYCNCYGNWIDSCFCQMVCRCDSRYECGTQMGCTGNEVPYCPGHGVVCGCHGDGSCSCQSDWVCSCDCNNCNCDNHCWCDCNYCKCDYNCECDVDCSCDCNHSPCTSNAPICKSDSSSCSCDSDWGCDCDGHSSCSCNNCSCDGACNCDGQHWT